VSSVTEQTEQYQPNSCNSMGQELSGATSTKPQVQPVLPSSPPREIRVAWVAGPGTLDRLGRTIQPLAIGLIDELVKLMVICPMGEPCEELPSPPIEIMRYGTIHRWWKPGKKLIPIAAEFKKHRVQLLHALDGASWKMCRELSRLADLPCVVSSYNLDDPSVLGRLSRCTRTVIAASQPVRQALLERRALQTDRVRLIRPGLFQVRQPTCFVQPESFVSIIICGNLDDPAPFQTVLRSLADLASRNYDCVPFLIGSGRGERRLRAMADKLGLRRSITFIDRQPPRQLSGILKAGDLFVSPTCDREVPINVLLAMAAGVPVISAPNKAGDFLTDGKTALVFDPGNSGDLTGKLISLLEDHALAHRLAETALEYLRANHNITNAVSSLVEVYKQATST